ncbi:MAG: hypothetical protein US62_C0017G0020 [Candidatus Woesebacteria bacterium GW2011_GWA1_37_8]|uniref:Uncharacterized protein n=2 Tax=Candidatus Woeseibacteriota TaxID=1752722 RepID=A0A0G0L558_9BACT|nr:MAG: hypothetical protein US39_C0015G0013 [Microgenomates group bacterium GW2011_GWC1_37_12b]KKQ45301.1 MAG: hypothetical protein US62_C0017G0020 [Candidatus Woesebacteria bacterium GW2011_GWA1_37_8]KKQ87103.1 MAG: hypothetical protein UT10_C0011G0034 [Candidatus Woesebacteria bacterium GW2011_GWB1_38_8b]
MRLLINTLISVPFFLTSLFILWKKLRDDYIASQIFSLGFGIYFSLVAGFLLFHFFKFSYSEWFIVAAPVVVVLYLSNRGRMRLNELVNALAPLLYVSNIYYYLMLVILRNNYFGLIGVFLSVFFLVIYFLLEKNYKKLQWYKSGKIGFSGLFVLSVYFFMNSALAILIPDMVFFSGKINAIISMLLGLIFAFALTRLSKKVS